MTVWQLDPSAEFLGVMLDDSDTTWGDWRRFSSRKSLRGSWTPPRIRYHTKADFDGLSVDGAPPPRGSDALAVSLMVVFSRRAVDRIGKVLLRHGEFLPVVFEDDYAAYHCTNEIDALDPAQSECNQDGSLVYRGRCTFKRKSLRGQHVFRIAQDPYTLFVSDALVEQWRSAGLKGLDFQPVWSTDPALCRPSHAEVRRAARAKQRARRVVAVRAYEDPKRLARALKPCIKSAEERLGVKLAKTPADEVMQRIQDAIEAFRAPLGTDPDAYDRHEADDLAMDLAAVWGEIICRDLGWERVWLEFEDGEPLGLASPTRSHVIVLDQWFRHQIEDGERAPTSLELYRVLKTGSAPRSKRNGFLVVGA